MFEVEEKMIDFHIFILGSADRIAHTTEAGVTGY